ncbi:Muskelin N-terminus-domain-containing protein [Desarmillaria tabescens]|uniref:Muskelin N-terminus-domain-containing protein n=1 Tax=Armillaria tabescens TaxID=1929756 RepID=A0AA39JV47_ARMTA|nr:Muskelin N-terminus-domain-containing protein [Desarmillaria tabescens]KAK0448391.1 Muskelin N-terminus-domain-containing protein [Desarmillaria tabescens]
MKPSVPLSYSIAQGSPHSGQYAPENILVDNPSDQSSRWSGAATHGATKQWILLRLDSLAVVKSITFGKHIKAHPCNVKEFQISVGMTEDNMTEIFRGVLKNDSIPETFSIRHTNSSGVCFPTCFVKIIPISSHSPWFSSFNMVHLLGQASQTTHISRTSKKSMTNFAKQLPSGSSSSTSGNADFSLPTQPSSSAPGSVLSIPLVSELYDAIVLRGKLGRRRATPRTNLGCGALYGRLHGTNADGDVPCPRGGHAMCIDTARSIIYLFGGWDGQKSLDDFWAYDIKDDKWRVLCHSTSSEQNAPGARSCHKMVFDSKTGSIYVFGRLGDGDSLRPSSEARTETATPSAPAVPCSEFYRYHTRGADSGKWDYLAFDTAASGGPPLIFDHQMVMDSDAQIVYIFGGRVVDDDVAVKYSGLYSYNTLRARTFLLASDIQWYSSQRRKTLFIFAGQRDDKYLSDMYAYDIATNTVTELFSNFTASGGPDACFTQRAVIDPRLKELYIFCGLTRAPHAGSLTVLPSEPPNWVFRYHTRPGQWVKVLPEQQERKSRHPCQEPVPRYAHQVVYDPSTKTVFMHGGNAGITGAMERAVDGEEGGKETRLDDFWRMNLVRPAVKEIIRRAKFRLRQQQFREMSETVSQVKALAFLQTEVSSVVDHNDPTETELFRSLLTHLLTPQSPTPVAKKYPSEHEDSPPRKRSRPNTPEDDTDSEEWVWSVYRLMVIRSGRAADPVESEGEMDAERFKQRTEVFEELLGYVSSGAKQPGGSLLDMVDADCL